MRLIAVIAAIIIGGFLFMTYDKFIAEATTELHRDMPMVNRSIIRKCVKSASSGLSNSQKEIIVGLLKDEQNFSSMAEAEVAMEDAWVFLGEATECINREFF